MASSILSTPFRYVVAVFLLIISTTSQSVHAFAPPSHNNHQCSSTSSPSRKCPTFSKTKRVHNKLSPLSPLSATSSTTNNVVEITFPTPEEAASMGIRDWPQQFHDKSWDESIPEGQIATRYVLSGKGRVTIDYYEEENMDVRQRKKERVYPGTLIEVDGEANLFWEVDDNDGKEGMIVLTPSYEEGGKLLLVAGALVVFCAGLIAGSSGF